MAHNNMHPDMLDEAFGFCDAGDAPLDTLNRKPLGMSNSRVATMIYSVGPDTIDDQMMEISDSDRRKPPGDLAMMVEFN